MNSTPLTSTSMLVALEKAAKYICTSKCGLCPMVTEGFRCPKECDLDTKPWQCWFIYFREKSVEGVEAPQKV